MFRKKSYSDLEVQEMMESLFLEKKKVKELQLQLSNSSFLPNPSSSMEIAELNHEIKTLLHRIEEGKMRERQLESQQMQIADELVHLKAEQKTETPGDKQKEAQLERVVQFMRTRLEEAQFENHELLQKCNSFEKQEQAFQEKLLSLKQTEEALAESLLLEKQEKQSLQEEEAALKGQIDQLRTELLKMQEALAEKVNFAGKLEESKTASLKEAELFKHMMMKTLQDFKEERSEEELAYQSQILHLKEANESYLKQISDLTLQIEEQHATISALKNTLEALELEKTRQIEELKDQKRAHLELAQFSEELKAKILQSDAEKSNALESLLKKEELVNNLSSQVANLSRLQEKMEETVRQNELTCNEHESRLRAAQQHLAKKMRELSSLNEQNEELNLRIQNLEKLLEDSKCKLIELKAQSEAEALQKTSMQKQYQESLKAIETQSLKWEEKYFQIHEKWQETEARNREMKRLEDKFGKLQNLFSHLGGILSSSSPLEVPDAPKTEPISIKKFSEVEIISKEDISTAVQPTLFEKAPAQGRYKETLFG